MRMRKIVVLGVLGMALLFCNRAAMAQERAQAEVYLGANFARFNQTNFGGWGASITGNVNSWLGITADFSGLYNSPIDIYTYTFGPRLSVPPGDSSLVPFTQATFGVARLGIGSFSDNGFGAYIGGGLDWMASERIAVRLMQIDAMLTRISGSNLNGTRLSFGVVFHLGSR
jgi:hypothetical protein